MSRVDKGGRSFRPTAKTAGPRRTAPSPAPSLITVPRASATPAPGLPAQDPRHRSASVASTFGARPPPSPAAPPVTLAQPEEFAVPALPPPRSSQRAASILPSDPSGETTAGIAITPEYPPDVDDQGHATHAAPGSQVARGRVIPTSAASAEPRTPLSPNARPRVTVTAAPPGTTGDDALSSGGNEAGLLSAKSKMAAKAKAAKAGRQGRRSMSVLSGRTGTPALSERATPAPGPGSGLPAVEEEAERDETMDIDASVPLVSETSPHVSFQSLPSDSHTQVPEPSAYVVPSASVSASASTATGSTTNVSSLRRPTRGVTSATAPTASTSTATDDSILDPQLQPPTSTGADPTEQATTTTKKRGRPKKTVEPEVDAPAPKTRGRPKKVAAPETVAPVKSKRGAGGKGKGKARAEEAEDVAVQVNGDGEADQAIEEEESTPRMNRKRLMAKRKAETARKAAASQDGTSSNVVANGGVLAATKASRKGNKPAGEHVIEAEATEGAVKGKGKGKGKRKAPEATEDGPSPTTPKKRRASANTRLDDGAAGSASDSEEEDPSNLTMLDLALGSAKKGRKSEVLSERMKLVRERMKRDKKERQEATKAFRRKHGARYSDEEAADAEAPAQEGGADETEQAEEPSRAEDGDDDLPDVDAATSGEAVVPRDPDAEPADEEEAAGVEEAEEEEYDAPPINAYAAKVRLVNGKMIIDEDSLQVQRVTQADPDDLEVVADDDAARLINSNTWGKRIRGDKWTVEETLRFYDALRMFGTDFEMICHLFPGRTRKQIRHKWNREEKENGDVITRIMMGEKIAIDVDEYGKAAGMDFSGPCPDDPMDKWREMELNGELGPVKASASQVTATQEGPTDEADVDAARRVGGEADDAEAGWGEPGLLAGGDDDEE